MTDTEPLTNSQEPAETPTPQPDTQASAPSQSAEQQLAQVKDLLLRKAAEFDNYKKRMEQESISIIRMANEGLILAFLPVIDDLERSLKAAKDSPDASAIIRGIELIYQKCGKILEGQGVTALETLGKQFDVHFHDALMQIPTAASAPSTILEEVEKGYQMHSKVIRHAKVVVAAPPADAQETSPGGAVD